MKETMKKQSRKVILKAINTIKAISTVKTPTKTTTNKINS